MSCRLDRLHGRLRVGDLPGVGRLANRPAADVLENAGVNRERVIPALALEDLQVDGAVAELALEAAVQDLDDVGLGDAGAELVDEGVDGRAGPAVGVRPRGRSAHGKRTGNDRRNAVRRRVAACGSRHCHGYTAPQAPCRSPPQNQLRPRPTTCGGRWCSWSTTSGPGG